MMDILPLYKVEKKYLWKPKYYFYLLDRKFLENDQNIKLNLSRIHAEKNLMDKPSSINIL